MAEAEPAQSEITLLAPREAPKDALMAELDGLDARDKSGDVAEQAGKSKQEASVAGVSGSNGSATAAAPVGLRVSLRK